MSKQTLFASFRDFTVIFLLLFFNRFWRFKSVLGSFFAFFAKIWPKNMYRSSRSRFVLFDLFYLVTWDDLDLYYGHKAQEMTLTDVSDTIHADSLGLFALNIEVLLADVTKPEKSKFWLWPNLWRHQWPPGQIFYLVVHVQGHRMAFEIWNSVH